MQQLTAPPPVSSPTSSMSAGAPYAPPPQPRIGAPIPGTTGGLPAQSGLNVFQNPMAQALQSMGRGDDKVLVHMTPGEVQSLRGLAQLTGGDLTTNPNTGLPEAGWLGNLLPTILGGLGALIGLPTWAIGLGGVAGGTAATGSLTKGLMTGLQAFGGAGLTSALGGQGALGNVLGGGATPPPVPVGATPPIAPPPASSTLGSLVNAPPVTTTALPTNLASQLGAPLPAGVTSTAGATGLIPKAVQPLLAESTLGQAAFPGATEVLRNAPVATQAPGFLGRFRDATTIPGIGKLGATVGPYAAGLGVLTGVSGAFEREPKKPEEEGTRFPYKGPYTSTRERLTPAPIDLRGPNPSAQRSYFGPMKYFDRDGNEFVPGTPSTKPMPYYAKGGELGMDEGSFIFPARETAELGNGSSRAGQEVLARMGGKPIDGKGDGVSDSIPARIGGKQEARVARDEVYFSPQAVTRIGGGNHSRGTEKLYALMDRAKKARQRADVGADTKLRRGLA